MTNDEYKDIATADFTVRLIIGAIFGLILLIGGIIFAIILLVKKEYSVAGIIGLVAFGGLLVYYCRIEKNLINPNKTNYQKTK